jgi:hypothetical protein
MDLGLFKNSTKDLCHFATELHMDKEEEGFISKGHKFMVS